MWWLSRWFLGILLRLARYMIVISLQGMTLIMLQVVAVISAMKMEMAVQSPVSGVVRATHVAVGDKIDPEDLLVEIETE